MFTSKDVESGRRSVLWFILITGLLFAMMYSVGFARVFWMKQQEIEIAEKNFDKMIFYINFAFNGNAISGYVVAGAIAGALLTVSGHMMTISAAIANDILEVFEPDVPEERKGWLGYATIIASGILVTLIALDPPSFLVVSDLWAFSLSAAAIMPVIVLGVWSSCVNEYGAVTASIIGALVVVIFSPPFVPAVILGAGGLTSKIRLDAALVAVPVSVITLVVISLLVERLDVMTIDREENQWLINKMHGYPEDGVRHFASAWPLPADRADASAPLVGPAPLARLRRPWRSLSQCPCSFDVEGSRENGDSRDDILDSAGVKLAEQVQHVGYQVVVESFGLQVTGR